MSNTVSSLEKGLKTIELVSASAEGVSLKEIATHIGCSSPAALKLCNTLLKCGYIIKRSKPMRYTIGRKITELAGNNREQDYRGRIRESMLNINRRLPELSIYFSEYIGEQIHVTSLIRQAEPGVIATTAQSLLMPYTSVSSMVHLAFWPEMTTSEYCRRYHFDEYGSGLWKSEKNFRRELENCRKRGAYYYPFNTESLIRIGVPVRTADNQLLGALTLAEHLDKPLSQPQKRIEMITKIALSEIDYSRACRHEMFKQ